MSGRGCRGVVVGVGRATVVVVVTAGMVVATVVDGARGAAAAVVVVVAVPGDAQAAIARASATRVRGIGKG